MTECTYCPFEVDLIECDECDFPEVDDIKKKFRATCDICGTYIMIPFDAPDRFNLIVCKSCSQLKAKDIYDEFDDHIHADDRVGEFEGVFVAGTYKWW